MECISCIKDGITGICRDIKDKTARENIETLTTKLNEVINLVNNLSGVDGGHLATDEDINTLQASITALQTAINNLDSTYAKDSDITAINNAISDINTRIDSLGESTGGSGGGVTAEVYSDTQTQALYNKINSISDKSKILKLSVLNTGDNLTTVSVSQKQLDSNGIGNSSNISSPYLPKNINSDFTYDHYTGRFISRNYQGDTLYFKFADDGWFEEYGVNICHSSSSNIMFGATSSQWYNPKNKGFTFTLYYME